jgi:hypothetical protein
MLGGVEYVFEAELWLWEARRTDSWTFVRLPVDVSDEIRELSEGARNGFGSLRVRVRVGATAWRTSIFPDGTRGYVLPVKKAVRKAEHLDAGDVATVNVELVDL